MEKDNSKSILINKDNYENKIMFIMNQTIYSYNDAETKLKQHDYDHISVIKEYLGSTTTKNTKQILSINQEIYKQIRKHIDITEYNNSHPLNLEHVKNNILEEQSKQQQNN
jgi:TPP-dependent pyruvate/acetoin dehydrogenase alpha subunit